MRVWPSEGAATVSRAINSEYAEVIAQCTAVRYGSDGAPEESRWMLIRTAVSSMPESELGWVPLECCAEYTEGNSHQAVFPLKLSADYGQGGSWFVRVDGTDADGNVLVSAPGGWSAAALPFLPAAMLILCPVLFDVAAIMPYLAPVSDILAATHYLRGELSPLLMQAAVLFFAAAALRRLNKI